MKSKAATSRRTPKTVLMVLLILVGATIGAAEPPQRLTNDGRQLRQLTDRASLDAHPA